MLVLLKPDQIRLAAGGLLAALVPCLVAGGLNPSPAIAQLLPVPAPVAPSPSPTPIFQRPLTAVPTPADLGMDAQIWGEQGFSRDYPALLAAIDHSLRYLNTAKAAKDYRQLALPGVTRERVRRSLVRFRQLVVSHRSASQLQAAVEREFVLYQAAGKDGLGTVQFTGYFEPVHQASRVPTAEFRYPIFRLPHQFAQWRQPHPTRLELEGADGLQYGKGLLRGAELVWLRDRLDAFLIQVQGSARLQLTDGSTMSVGFAGNTNYPYTGIGRELVQEGKFSLEELTLPKLLQYFRDNPADMDVYLPRNQRFVFFRPTGGAPATGSIGVPVMGDRSIATDKNLFPPGGLALIQTRLPYPKGTTYEQRLVTRYVLDHDTGSAIKGAGRVDVFTGTGKVAGDRAGLINAQGQLYYLLLKP